MSDFSFNMDMSGASGRFRRLFNAFNKVPSAMNRAGLYFIGEIQEEFYSGRKDDDTGLNVITNRLRDSWFPMVMGQGTDTILNVITDVKYAKVHEDGSESRNLPARTDVVNTWENKGLKMVKDEVMKVLRS